MENLINKITESEFVKYLLQSGLVIAAVTSIIKYLLDNMKLRKVWKCKIKISELSMYLLYMILYYVSIFAYPIIAYMAFPENYFSGNNQLLSTTYLGISIIINFLAIMVISCLIWKRLKKFKKYAAVYFVIIISFLNSYVYYFHIMGDREGLYICGCVLVLEFIGFKVFDKDFLWQYNKVKIFIINNNNVIEARSCDISNKGEWFIVSILNNNKDIYKELRIPKEQVFKLEFFDKQF